MNKPLAGALSLAITAVVLVLALPPRQPAAAADVVGMGSPGDCTEAALKTALAGGGLVTFSCGAGPVTITLGSPAINAGTNAGCPVTDQRGVPRIGTCDLAACRREKPTWP